MAPKTSVSEKNSFMTLFFTQFVLSYASNNTTSRNIGRGRMHGPSPTSNFLGTIPPKSQPMELSDIWPQVPTSEIKFRRSSSFLGQSGHYSNVTCNNLVIKAIIFCLYYLWSIN